MFRAVVRRSPAAEKKGEATKVALEVIATATGDEGFAITCDQKLSSKEIAQLSGLDADEIKRVKPFIESGWTLKNALSYKSTSFTCAHNIRQLIDRTIEQGGSYMLEIEAYSQKWTIEVKLGAAS